MERKRGGKLPEGLDWNSTDNYANDNKQRINSGLMCERRKVRRI
jgi:hypothetical protein